MTFGPGKYDDLCSFVRLKVGMKEGGAVMVIVLGGNRGNGFSCQADLETATQLPDLLEAVAAQMRKDIAG